jgi:hypothetical protein
MNASKLVDLSRYSRRGLGALDPHVGHIIDLARQPRTQYPASQIEIASQGPEKIEAHRLT